MLQPAKTAASQVASTGLKSYVAPTILPQQENRIQWCLDKPQVPFRNSPIRNRLELLLHIRSASSWSTLWFYCSTLSKLLGTTHTQTNKPKWNLKLWPLSEPLKPPPPFWTLPWPSPYPSILPHDPWDTRPRTQQLEPSLTLETTLAWYWTPEPPQTNKQTNKQTNNTSIPHNTMPIPPLPEWNPWDRVAPLKEECQQYYQATIQYHYCAQGYLAHYPNLPAQLPDLPAALDMFTNKGAILAYTSDLCAHLADICYLYSQGDLMATMCKQSVVDIARPTRPHLKVW